MIKKPETGKEMSTPDYPGSKGAVSGHSFRRKEVSDAPPGAVLPQVRGDLK